MQMTRYILLPFTYLLFLSRALAQAPPNEVVFTHIIPGAETYLSGSVEPALTADESGTVKLQIIHQDAAKSPTNMEVQVQADSTFITGRFHLDSGDTITARLLRSNGSGEKPPGPQTVIPAVPYPCKDGASGPDSHDFTKPTLSLIAVEDNEVQAATLVRKLGKENIARVLLCDRAHLVVAELGPTSPDATDEKLFTMKHLHLAAKARFYVEVLGEKGSVVTSESGVVPEANELTGDYRVAMVGGAEYGGYSSQAQNTNAFVQLFVESPYKQYLPKLKHIYVSNWGRIRLLGVASPSTSGVGSTVLDAAGSVTKQDFSSIGQALDYAVGTQFALSKETYTFGRYSLILGGGATTPLSPSQSALTFKIPALAASECAAVISKFSLTGKGYVDGSAYTDPAQNNKSSPQCLLSNDAKHTTPIKDIAFANQDRSNFLGKWGFGLRATGTFGCAKGRTQCADALALLDATFGQDAALTGGQMRNFVFKLDGLLPLRTGDAAYLYLFGSAYTRIVPNHNDDPLILAAEPNKPALPDPSVIVLPFAQPSRDYYRLGVGLNLQQIFCKLGTVLCDTKSK